MQRRTLLAKARVVGLHTQHVSIVPPEFPTGRQVPQDVVHYLVTMGTWAPSADNCQPWRFTWDGERLILYKDPERAGFFVDINCESTLITCGAVSENIRIAATHYGLEAAVTVSPSIGQSNSVVEITLRRTGVAVDPLYPFLAQRVVNRRLYRRQAVAQEVVTELGDVVRAIPGAGMLWIDNEDVKKLLQRLVFAADRILFEDQRLHQELFRWIRLGKGWATDDGLGVEVLELSWLQQKLFPAVASWRVLSRLNGLGVSRALAWNSIRLLQRSPAYCLLTMDERSPGGYIAGGRMMERFWLKANALGLSLQPMAGFLFLLNHWHCNGARQFRDAHRTMIQGMHTTLQTLLPEGAIPIMFCRLGYGDAPTARTPRRSVEDLLQVL